MPVTCKYCNRLAYIHQTTDNFILYHCGTGHNFAVKMGESMNQYMILRNPETYNNSAPKKFFSSLGEATAVAKKMTIEHRDTFYVIKLVKKVSLPEILVNVEDL